MLNKHVQAHVKSVDKETCTALDNFITKEQTYPKLGSSKTTIRKGMLAKPVRQLGVNFTNVLCAAFTREDS